MKPVLDSVQSRKADQYMIEHLGLPGIVLMEQAARASVGEILYRYPGLQSCCIVCGPGNNGGDGLAIARMLSETGIVVALVRAFPEKTWTGDAGLEYQILNNAALTTLQWLDFNPGLRVTCDLMIDAVFGTGLDRPLEGNAASVVNWMNAQDQDIIAIDIPSGLKAQSGVVDGPHIRATLTITFQTYKPAHLISPANQFCGVVSVQDIGISQAAITSVDTSVFVPEDRDIQQYIPFRDAVTHKGTYGHALLVGGNALAPGCMALATQAALAVGAGLVSGLVPGKARSSFFQEGWETMLRGPVTDDTAWLGSLHCNPEYINGVQALGIGPGMGTSEDGYIFLKWVLNHATMPLILDADALNLLARFPDLWEFVPSQTILTPHPGEMKRLQAFPDPVAYRLEAVKALAAGRNVIVVLKGDHTLVALPDGHVFINPTGNAGMATAGSGDVLTGVITGLLAQGLRPMDAAVSGVFLHGRAGDQAAAEIGMNGLRARDIVNHIPVAIHTLMS